MLGTVGAHQNGPEEFVRYHFLQAVAHQTIAGYSSLSDSSFYIYISLFFSSK